MPLTINLTQLDRKKRKDGTVPIYIRITENRKSKYKSTGISVLPKYWNADRQEVRRSHDDSKRLNRKLKKKRRAFEKVRDELEYEERLSAELLKQKMSSDTDPLELINQMEKYRDSIEGTEHYWEWKKFGVVITNMKRFLGSKQMIIDEVDAQFVERFQEFLLKEGGPKRDGKHIPNNPNTVRRKLTSLKSFFNTLIKNTKLKHDPFTAVDKVSENPVEKTKLTLEQIKKIENADLAEGSDLWHVRNYFMYSFYNAGIRFGDLCCLTWENIVDGRLVYKMNKTGGQKSIKQLEPMKQILDLYRHKDSEPKDYIFPILDQKYSDPFELRKAIGSKNVLINADLKKLAKSVGIEANISFHVSRHSFSHYALKKGMDLYSISKALGHADLKTTQHYLKQFDEDLLDKSMNNLFKD